MLTDDLIRRLRTERAKALVLPDGLDPADAVMLACDLLVAGIGDDAVVALAAEPPRTLSVHDAERRLLAVAEALGLAGPSTTDAVTVVAADTCHRILDGSLPPRGGVHRLLVTGHEASPLDDLTPAVLALAGHLEDDLFGSADEAFRADLATLARRVLDAIARLTAA